MSISIRIFLGLCVFSGYLLGAQNRMAYPPGTLRLNDSLFIDRIPVTNLMFVEYMVAEDDLRKSGYTGLRDFFAKNRDAEISSIKNVLLWPSPFLIDLYATHKSLKRKGYDVFHAYEHHPVLTVSKSRAEDYCRWRTEMVRILWKYDSRFAANKDLVEKITYRLATREELKAAKDFFTSSNSARIYKRRLFRSVDKDYTGFVVFPIDELTRSKELFNEDASHRYTGFRCVCELRL